LPIKPGGQLAGTAAFQAPYRSHQSYSGQLAETTLMVIPAQYVAWLALVVESSMRQHMKEGEHATY
jgi:hypothetical protein